MIDRLSAMHSTQIYERWDERVTREDGMATLRARTGKFWPLKQIDNQRLHAVD
jgi:hypothetical protein